MHSLMRVHDVLRIVKRHVKTIIIIVKVMVYMLWVSSIFMSRRDCDLGIGKTNRSKELVSELCSLVTSSRALYPS